MRAELVDRIERPSRSGGVNWSKPILVLARCGDKELWRQQGHSGSSRMLISPEYHPGTLLLVPKGEYHWRSYGCQMEVIELQEGGRISRAAFLRHALTIDKFFGAKVAQYLDPKKTLLITKHRPKCVRPDASIGLMSPDSGF